MAWCAGIFETLWLLLALVLGSDAGLNIFGLFTIVYGAAGLIVLWVVRLLLHALSSRGQPWRRFRVWAVEPVLIAVVVGCVWWGLFLWPRFLLSLPALDRYAKTVQQGPPESPGQHAPRLVGLFLVRETEVLPHGIVRVITTSCMFDDCGLAFSPRHAKPPRIGEDSYDRLSFGWWRWWRSW